VARTIADSPREGELHERARRVLRRELLVASTLLLALASALVGARLAGVSLAAVDRPVIALAALTAVAVLRAARSAWRAWRLGIAAALPSPPEPLDAAVRSELDEHDGFFVAQRFRLVGARYELNVLAADGRSPDRPIAVVEREAFAPRERFEARTPHASAPGRGGGRWAGELVFLVHALQVLDVGGRYRVDNSDGARVGELRKVFGTSLYRSTWEIWDGAGTLVATARERSVPVAILRRTIGVIPVLGEVLGMLPIPYHFDLHAVPSAVRIGSFTRLRSLRDRYALTIDGDPHRSIDRRLALALAVSLDRLEGR